VMTGTAVRRPVKMETSDFRLGCPECGAARPILSSGSAVQSSFLRAGATANFEEDLVRLAKRDLEGRGRALALFCGDKNLSSGVCRERLTGQIADSIGELAVMSVPPLVDQLGVRPRQMAVVFGPNRVVG